MRILALLPAQLTSRYMGLMVVQMVCIHNSLLSHKRNQLLTMQFCHLCSMENQVILRQLMAFLKVDLVMIIVMRPI